MAADITFLDTETLGLDPAAPVWEFAACRRLPNGEEVKTCFTIRHNPGTWLDGFPEEFARDYRARYDPATARDEYLAALAIHKITRGAHVVGAVPNFDTERLALLLRRHDIEPAWNYHLIDIENLVVGYLLGRNGRLLALPWKSDALSEMIGVDPADFERHTAMGDVQWTMAQWDVITSVCAFSGTTLDLSSASAEEINAVLKEKRGWKLAFDLLDESCRGVV